MLQLFNDDFRAGWGNIFSATVKKIKNKNHGRITSSTFYIIIYIFLLQLNYNNYYFGI